MARDTDYIEVKVVHLCRDGKHSLNAVRHITFQEYDQTIAKGAAVLWTIHLLRKQLAEQIRLRRFNSFDPEI